MDLTLRKLEKKDLEFLLEVRNDESTRMFLENDSIFSIDECTKWFEQEKPNWFIIEIDKLSVGYLRTNGDEVGCDIHPKFRRRGYAKLAYTKFLENKKFASLWVFKDNFAIDLYKKLGFAENGEIKTIRNRDYVKMIYK